MAIRIKKSTFTLHPEGFYTGELVEIAEEESEYGPRIKFVFETGEKKENGESLGIWHYCSPKLSPLSKLSTTLTGILGCKFDDLEEEFDLAGLKGRKTRITVKHVTSQNTGTEFAKIESFLPESGGVDSQQPTQQPAQATKAQNIRNDVNVEFANAGSEKEEVPF